MTLYPLKTLHRIGLMDQMPPISLEVEQSYRRSGKPRRVLVAFSGGSDSTALLFALVELSKKLPMELCCVHVNHGLRSGADAEEDHARLLALKLGIPFIAKRVRVSTAGNLEDNARKSRYNAFLEAKAETGCDAVALAHHAGDQAETFLMHLMRGAGLDGLSGMREWRAPFWRPFLRIPKEEITAYLLTCGAEWVEDESNRNPAYLRNRIRLKLLPLMESFSPGATLRIAAAAGRLSDEREEADAAASSWLRQNARMEDPFYFLLAEPFKTEPPSLQRRVLRKLVSSAGVRLDFAQTEALLERFSAVKQSSWNLPGGFRAFFSRKRLHILPEAVESSHVSWPQPTRTPAEPHPNGARKWQVLDAESLDGAVMRQARSGDWIEPLGMEGRQTLRKFLSARGVDVPFRPIWPVFARDDGLVLWVPGFGAGRTAAVTEQTNRAVRLEFLGLMPDEIHEEDVYEPGM